MAIYEEDYCGAYTRALLMGNSEEEVTSLISKYLKDYPKAGYATEVLKPVTDKGGGVFEAIMRRSKHCE